MRTSITSLLLATVATVAAVTGSGPVPLPAAFQKTAEPTRSGHRYPDFGYLPAPQQYEGRVFKLSQDYPTALPAGGDVPEIATRDFDAITKDWRTYLLDVRAYCFRGNIRGHDVEDDWQVEHNTENHWYHMPWQHYGPTGREGIHGLTKEAPVQPQQLAESQTYTGGQTYAVGFYNTFGGYTIGEVWKDHEHPAKDLKKIEFPVGTVVCKVLFVDIPPDQVPSLNPALIWHGYITENFTSTDRSIRRLSLIQMDIMVRVRDARAPTGWVFGTFQYNGKRPGARPQPSWDNLVPVGLQWGNDPEITTDTSNPTPKETIINKQLKQSVINPDANELPPTHLGWNGRLNGPVDNPRSSCMSCHLTAESPQRSQISPLFEKNPPKAGSPEWMRWFQNPKCGTAFDQHVTPTDFSLQMAIALQNFRSWRNAGSKILASRYKSQAVPARIKDLPARNVGGLHDPEESEVEIRRDYKAP